MKIINYIKQNILAFWISLFYIVLGGVVACNLYPEDSLNGILYPWIWLITLPVNAISFSYLSTGGEEYSTVTIIQIIMFIPTFIIISRLIAKKNKKQP
jgi:hypothetical protein